MLIKVYLIAHFVTSNKLSLGELIRLKSISFSKSFLLTLTTREKPSSSAGLKAISSAGHRATDMALQLTFSSSALLPAVLLYLLSSSAVHTSATAKWFSSSVFLFSAKEHYYYIFTYIFLLRICDVFVHILYSILIIS